jgi:hypothetical protein
MLVLFVVAANIYGHRKYKQASLSALSDAADMKKGKAKKNGIKKIE